MRQDTATHVGDMADRLVMIEHDDFYEILVGWVVLEHSTRLHAEIVSSFYHTIHA